MRIIEDHQGKFELLSQLMAEEIDAFNAKSGLARVRDLCFYLVDENDKFMGGLKGYFEGDWMYVSDLLAVRRNKGDGGKLMEHAETFARNNQRKGILLYTMAFQARPFYEKLGFEMFAEIPQFAGEYSAYFMKKVL
jgi:GNAT superfamily N-acetyltransferase